MGYGIPVLGRDVGGITEIQRMDTMVSLLKMNMIQLKKISLLATDRELYKRLSANARETYESKFTLEKMCDAYKKVVL